ncbi:MAG: type I DNA topoisomerase [Clostridia bacterium]|nr:type I DNA topoisomerase [Clostridia bacterium]
MKLVIVESPSKAKTIGKYLGQEYRVKASGGHISDLPQKKLGIDIENNFQPEYVINDDKKKAIAELKSLVKDAEIVYLATDPDREGEAISWHLKTVLGIPDGEIRIVFNEISKKAVNNAISIPRYINMNLVNAQQARRVLDRLVGYKLSPILSKKIKSGLSAGRVQSVALRMLVDREREIREFVPQEYWNLFAHLKDAGQKFKAGFEDINGKKIKIPDRATLDVILNATEKSEYLVDNIKEAVKKVMPQPPFTTSTLQQDATIKFSMSAPQVMQIAQQLYEGFEIEGEGHVALVTYIRTDSVRVSDDAMYEARDYINAKYGNSFLPKYPNKFKQKDSSQDAHEAIRPISLEVTPDSLRNKLTKNHYNIYKLIYDRFVASQMAAALYNTLVAHIAVSGNDGNIYGYAVKGRVLKFAGYTAVYADLVSNGDDEENSATLPDIKEGQKLELEKLVYEQKFTKPPMRYSEASLVKGMEENGIGRPSTYASIISVLAKRTYSEKEGKYMVPTVLGEAVIDTLKKYFEDIIDLKFTANMEKELDGVEDGREWQLLIKDFYPKFITKVLKAHRDGSQVKLADEESDVVCEKCGSKMVIKEGRFGKFLACPNYPDCKNAYWGQPTGDKCPDCGSLLIKDKTGQTVCSDKGCGYQA